MEERKEKIEFKPQVQGTQKILLQYYDYAVTLTTFLIRFKCIIGLLFFFQVSAIPNRLILILSYGILNRYDFLLFYNKYSCGIILYVYLIYNTSHLIQSFIIIKNTTCWELLVIYELGIMFFIVLCSYCGRKCDN